MGRGRGGDELADAGCTLVQGWLIAYPMPADELSEWMAANRLGTDTVTLAG
jgi:EAL domain-containing protein (putative c-di-GMP-specific phosphodiesterase class I)